MLARLAFFAVLALTLIGFDALVWSGLRRLPPPGRARRAVGLAYWLLSVGAALAVSAGLALATARPSARWELGLLALAGLPKLVFLFAWAVEAAIRLPLIGVARLRGRSERPRAASTGPLAAAGAIAAAVLLILLGHAWAFDRSALVLERVSVSVPGLPPGLDGLRIAQVSDLHIDSIDAAAVDRVVGLVAAARPDLVVATGDIGTLEECRRGPELLGRLVAPLGKLAVLGNHDLGRAERAADNFADESEKQRYLEELDAFYRERGFELLRNDCRVIERGGRLAVAGVAVFDPHHGWRDADLSAALEACPSTPAVLLAHNPQMWEQEVDGRVAVPLTLSGHTHGGQLAIRLGPARASVARAMFRHWGGLSSSRSGALYVSRGVGYVGLPYRLGAAPEVTLFELRTVPSLT